MMMPPLDPVSDISPVPQNTRPRRPTVQSDMQVTILRPGTVRINVQGAFIVDEEPLTPRTEEYNHDSKDIRLPNHTAVVSHVAVDVSCPALPCTAPRRGIATPPPSSHDFTPHATFHPIHPIHLVPTLSSRTPFPEYAADPSMAV